MMSRTLAVGVLAAAVIVGLDFGCRPKLELRGKPCTVDGHQCGPGEGCVTVYVDGDCTGDGYCARSCTDDWEECSRMQPGDLREKCLETARMRTTCSPDLVCKHAPRGCVPRGVMTTMDGWQQFVCLPESLDPNKGRTPR